MPPILIHRPTIELTPTFRAVRAIPSTTTTPLAQLQRKMSFLLSITCFLRPSDVQRIDRASMICQGTESLDFRVVAPKETRGHRRIIKPFHVCAHADPLLHDPERERLLVNTTLPGHELQATTISTWHRRFLRLSTPEHVSVRSLASSLALKNGIPYDQIMQVLTYTPQASDGKTLCESSHYANPSIMALCINIHLQDVSVVVTQGNWVSSIITFKQHYHRDQLATHDFSAAVLSYNGDPISIDQVLVDP
ncbi:hypothetical protein [Parasitella parasitica]|uniref:Uncharacterized protein n=1 Tax=Parasitella parasitica TaxID=35722 RepID=A0A0B7N1Y8_9FUNG|nr:hypothetical protein [Parasitella parasitica]